jgi:ribosomal protein S18 acetylase RimI-like enzyme
MTTRRYPIRDARPSDAGAISHVHQASREALYRGRIPDTLVDVLSPEERLRRWQEWLDDPAVTTIVGEDDGRIVGFSTLRAAVDPDLDGATVAEMPTLYVHPTYWSCGWGTALCREIERRGVQQGFGLLTLWVMEMNERARAFYAARGFAEDGAEKLAEAPDPIALKALRYRKKLG